MGSTPRVAGDVAAAGSPTSVGRGRWSGPGVRLGLKPASSNLSSAGSYSSVAAAAAVVDVAGNIDT